MHIRKLKPDHKSVSLLIGVAVVAILVAVISLVVSRLANEVPLRESQQTGVNQGADRATLILAASGEWLEYSSAKGGYSIMYPPNWEPGQDGSENGGILFKLKDPEESQRLLRIGVTVIPVSSDWDLQRVMEEKTRFLGEDLQAAGVQVNPMMVNGMEAIEFVGLVERFRGVQIVILSGTTLFILWAQPIDQSHPIDGQWAEPLHALLRAMANSIQVH